jgi:replication factor A1
MPAEEIINEIISKRPGTSREQILKALEEEKTRTAGFIADSTLLRLIAYKLGAEIPSEKVPVRILSTKSLVPKLNDVTISGRIIATYPTKTFEGSKPGKFASLIIADKDGLLRVMLWNDKADLASELLKTGEITRFSHAYTREDRNGKTELHLGEKSSIEINPQDLKEEDYPSIEGTATKISQVASTQSLIHLMGRAKNISGVSTFTRQDQTTGKVMRFTLFDETGEATIVAWNEKAEELAKKLEENKTVRLINVRIKSDSNDGLELHADASTFQEVTG